MSTTQEYVGSELELFATAKNWKQYFSRMVIPFLGKDVLEVGAGLGGTTKVLCRSERESWTCLEPDPDLCTQVDERIEAGDLPAACTTFCGTLDDLPAGRRFDSLLYMDVLEHIEDDRAEVARAAERLAPGGHLIVLAHAHNYLFTPFDEAVGHYRRYDRGLMKKAAEDAEGLRLVRLRFLDTVGLAASLANRLFLKQSMPSASQIRLWDGAMVPLSRFVDPLSGYRLGKSILGVWRREH